MMESCMRLTMLLPRLAPLVAIALAATGCPNDVQPVALDPIGPWSASDYDLRVVA